MEKKENWLLVCFILFFLFIGVSAFIHFYKAPVSTFITPTSLPTAYYNPTSSPSSLISICNANDLSAVADFQGAAGSIYGNLTITNTSNKDCQITLGNIIKANYSASNITISYKSNVTASTFTLSAGSHVYSQVHYPNGPQCQSQISQKPITLIYEANNIKVNFKDKNGNINFLVSACSGNENTTIDLRPLSANALNM